MRSIHISVRFLAVVLSMLLVTFATSAQTEDAAKAPTYENTVQKLKSGDTKIDFKALRIAFTHTKGYGPYGGDSDGKKAAFAALDAKKYKEAVKKAEEMLKNDFVDMDAHIAASLGYSGLGDSTRSDFHKKIYLGLVNSILSSGDGKTAETAYVVISTHEEYIILRALGLGIGSQSLVHQGGHAFDVLTATDPKTNASVKIFFNIDIPWKAETEMFNPKN